MAFLSNEEDPASYPYDQEAFEKKDVDENRSRTPALKFYRKLQKVTDHNVRYTGARYLQNITALLTALTSAFVIWGSA